MIPPARSIPVATFALAFALGAVARSQTTRPGEARVALTGQRAWVVIKGSLHNFESDRDDRPIADFDTESEANEDAARREAAEPEIGRWTYLTKRRDRLDEARRETPADDALRDLAAGNVRAAAGDPSPPASTASRRPIVVRVYKREGKAWVEQPDRRFSTPFKYNAASDYFNAVRSTVGWTATWNAPNWPKPKPPGGPRPASPVGDPASATVAEPGPAGVGLEGTWAWSDHPIQKFRLTGEGRVDYIHGDSSPLLNRGGWTDRDGEVSFEIDGYKFRGRLTNPRTLKGTLLRAEGTGDGTGAFLWNPYPTTLKKSGD